MKKLLFSIAAVLSCSILHVNAQNVIYEETFDSVNPPDLPTTITLNDIDLDGNNWLTMDTSSLNSFDGTYNFTGNAAVSLSYDLVNNMDPDNLLITPEVVLPVGEAAILSFLTAGLKLPDVPQNSDEHYGVYVIPVGSGYQGGEIPVHEETLPQPGATFERSIDLSAFAGQTVKIYFRHFNSANQHALILDDVKVIQGNLGTSENNIISEQVKIYPNPSFDYVYLNSRSKINQVQVFDSTGRKVEVKLIDNKVDVRNLPIGNYWFSITTGGKTVSKKIIKK